MCGRYVLFDFETLGYEYPLPSDFDTTPRFNVAPTHSMPVITSDGLRIMRWGLIPKWAKDEKIGYRLFNARSETVFDKPVWKSAILQRRCLVPANGFYEWQVREDGKHPFYVHPKDQPLFMFAGVWESWQHEGKEIETYSILTTDPNQEMRPLHDRMPVILTHEDHDQWLAADRREDIKPLLMPYMHGKLEMHEVSRSVNVTTMNDNRMIMPINSQ